MDVLIGMDEAAVEATTEVAKGAGEHIRWATLGMKALKLDRTEELSEQKAKNRELQRRELTKLAEGFTKTLELYRDYYEKFEIVSSSISSWKEARRFAESVAGFIEACARVRLDFADLVELTPDELDRLEAILAGMTERAGRVVERAALAVLDRDTEGLEELREEHGSFVALMRAVDRTEQINACTVELTSLTSDLVRLVALVEGAASIRRHDPATADHLGRVLARP